ncbi:MAG: hypothetical protein GXP56_08260 [Deltaproteobacteria bacterium]|nr:hypothetical protein [Deltaproteobacteria bacterium]
MIKKTVFQLTTFTAFVLIAAGVLFFNPVAAMACGYGNSGGSDFVPQRQVPNGGNQVTGNQAAAAIDQEQAKTIVKNHVSKLNPDLVVGNINDAGGFFEVEVMNKDNEVVQMLGVDKYSGRLMLIN